MLIYVQDTIKIDVNPPPPFKPTGLYQYKLFWLMACRGWPKKASCFLLGL